MAKDDNQLMKQVRDNDDREAFEELVLRYRDSAVKFILRYIKDYYIAEDLAQEAFAKIYINRDYFKSNGNFKAYLFQTLRNLSIDYHRKVSKVTEQKLIDNLIDEVDSPEEIALKNEKSGIIHNLLKSLNEQYKTVLYLQQYEGMSYKEIAQSMGLSLGQVRMLIYRSKKKLKNIIETELGGELW